MWRRVTGTSLPLLPALRGQVFKPWVMPANMDSYGVLAIIQYPFKVSNLKIEQIQKDDWNQCLEAHLSLESSKLRRKLCCCFWTPAAFFGSSPRTTFLLSPFLQAPPGTTHFLSSSSQPATPAHLPSLSPNYFLFSFFFFNSHWFPYRMELKRGKYMKKLYTTILCQEEFPQHQLQYMVDWVPKKNNETNHPSYLKINWTKTQRMCWQEGPILSHTGMKKVTLIWFFSSHLTFSLGWIL